MPTRHILLLMNQNTCKFKFPSIGCKKVANKDVYFPLVTLTLYVNFVHLEKKIYKVKYKHRFYSTRTCLEPRGLASSKSVVLWTSLNIKSHKGKAHTDVYKIIDDKTRLKAPGQHWQYC